MTLVPYRHAGTVEPLAVVEDRHGARAALFANRLDFVRNDGERSSSPIAHIGSVHLRRQHGHPAFIAAATLPAVVMYLFLTIVPGLRGGSCSYSFLDVMLLAWLFVAVPTCVLLFYLWRRWTLKVVAAEGRFVLCPTDLAAARRFRDRLADIGDLPVR